MSTYTISIWYGRPGPGPSKGPVGPFYAAVMGHRPGGVNNNRKVQ